MSEYSLAEVRNGTGWPEGTRFRVVENNEPTMYQHFRANNDVNGNPRRCFVVYGPEAQILDVIDEGYAGRPTWLRDLPQLPTVDVSVTEYRSFLKLAAHRV